MPTNQDCQAGTVNQCFLVLLEVGAQDVVRGEKVLSLDLAEISQFIVNSAPSIDSHHLLESKNMYHPGTFQYILEMLIFIFH